MIVLVLACFCMIQVAALIRSLRRVKGRASDQLTRTATALARGSTLLLEAKDWIRAAVEARFNQVKDATVSLVTTSTTALGRLVRSALFLASMIVLVLACFCMIQVAALIGSLRRVKGRASDQLSRARVSLHLADQVGRYRTHCRIIDRRRL